MTGSAPMYTFLKSLFYGCSKVFYATTEVVGAENIPGHNEATILCFNHGNSLGDPVVTISNMPRIVRFFAKDGLWKIPVIGTLVRMSAAIPVYRPREHGEKAKLFNEESFREVYKALLNGDCVGIAPEGVSTFRSYATNLKKGFAFIALETMKIAVEQGREDFRIRIVPQFIFFTHREKFRSDVLLRVRPGLVIDASWLKKDRKQAAEEITEVIEKSMFRNIISAQDFKTIKIAMTAARIHRPFGTYMSLNAYMFLVQGWVELLKQDNSIVLDGEYTIEEVRSQLESYQSLLDDVKVKDERIRRIEVNGSRPSTFKLMRIVLYRFVVCTVLTLLSAPGLIVWSPIWFKIRKKERELISKGPGWVDSFAETKMKYGFFYVLFLAVVTMFYSPFICALVCAYLWLTMRLYEENMACARSICGIVRLSLIPSDKLKTIERARSDAKIGVRKAVKLFPKYNAEGIKDDCGDDVQIDKSLVMNEQPRWWTNFNPMRRRKKDWNELLRLSDHCTMDYVE